MVSFIRNVFRSFTRGEKRGAVASGMVFLASGAGFFAITVAVHSVFVPVAGGAYREGIVGQPSVVNPIVSVNPADQDLSALLFAPLKTLLTSAERNRDASAYTLKLKEGLVWEDGAPLTSDDIVFTVLVAQDAHAESAFAAALKGVTVERVSALQTKLTLPSPNIFFEDLLARLPLIPQHAWERIPVANYHLSEYALRPVGNGPYRVDSFSKERDGFIGEYRLVPNKRYEGPAPFITNFSVRFFEDSSALLDAFRLRKIGGFGFLPPFPEVAQALEESAVAKTATPRYYAVFLNASANDLLGSADFRLALSRATDRARIAREAFQGNAESFLLGGAAEEAAREYDLEAATKLFAKAKAGPDASLTFAVPDVPSLVAAAEFMIADWRTAGAPAITLRKVPPARFREEILAPRAYEMALAPHAPAHQDDWYPLWHSSARGAAGENFSLYASKKIDELLEELRETERGPEREALKAQVMRALAKDLPAVFLVSLPYVHAHTEDLEGFPVGPLAAPSDRFLNAASWNVARVRMFK